MTFSYNALLCSNEDEEGLLYSRDKTETSQLTRIVSVLIDRFIGFLVHVYLRPFITVDTYGISSSKWSLVGVDSPVHSVH